MTATVSRLTVIQGDRHAPPGPCPDPDREAVARYLHRQGWSGLDAFHAGFDAPLCAAVLMLGMPPDLRLVTDESVRLILEASRS